MLERARLTGVQCNSLIQSIGSNDKFAINLHLAVCVKIVPGSCEGGN